MSRLLGYPASVGDKQVSVFYHAGPTSYVQVTRSPLANGDTLQAADAGMKYFDKVNNGVTDSGNFEVISIPPAANAKSTTNPNGMACKTYVLMWISRVTAAVGGQNQTAGTEAVAGTNLSAENVRLESIGRY